MRSHIAFLTAASAACVSASLIACKPDGLSKMETLGHALSARSGTTQNYMRWASERIGKGNIETGVVNIEDAFPGQAKGFDAHNLAFSTLELPEFHEIEKSRRDNVLESLYLGTKSKPCNAKAPCFGTAHGGNGHALIGAPEFAGKLIEAQKDLKSLTLIDLFPPAYQAAYGKQFKLTKASGSSAKATGLASFAYSVLSASQEVASNKVPFTRMTFFQIPAETLSSAIERQFDRVPGNYPLNDDFSEHQSSQTNRNDVKRAMGLFPGDVLIVRSVPSRAAAMSGDPRADSKIDSKGDVDKANDKEKARGGTYVPKTSCPTGDPGKAPAGTHLVHAAISLDNDTFLDPIEVSFGVGFRAASFWEIQNRLIVKYGIDSNQLCYYFMRPKRAQQSPHWRLDAPRALAGLKDCAAPAAFEREPSKSGCYMELALQRAPDARAQISMVNSDPKNVTAFVALLKFNREDDANSAKKKSGEK